MDDQNNNNESSISRIARKAQNTVDKTKKTFNKVKFFIKTWPIWVKLILIIITVCLVLGIFGAVTSFFKELLKKDSKDENAELSTVVQELQTMVSFTDDLKGLKVNKDYAKKIIKMLEESSVDTEQTGFRDEDYEFNEPDENSDNPLGGQTMTKDEDLQNIIDKYIRAEIKTMFPKINSSTAVDGIVKIKRYTQKDGNFKEIELKYVPYTQLLAEASSVATSIEAGEEILKHFSIDPNTFQLCVLVSSETHIWHNKKVDDGNPDSVQISFSLQRVNYMEGIQKYATPINYFLALHLISGDVEFMEELVQKIFDSTQITIGIVEQSVSSYVNVEYEGILTTTTTITYTQTTTSEKIPEEDETLENNSGNGGKNENGGSTTDESGAHEASPLSFRGKEYNVKVLPLINLKLDNDATVQKLNNSILVAESVGSSTWTEQLIEEMHLSRDENFDVIQKALGAAIKPRLTKNISNTTDIYVTEANTWILSSKMEILPMPAQRADGVPGTKNYSGIYDNWKDVPVEVPKGYEPPSSTTTSDGEYIYATSTSASATQTKTYDIDEISIPWTIFYPVSSVEKGEGYDLEYFFSLIDKYSTGTHNVKSCLINSPSMFIGLLSQNENTQELERVMRYALKQLTGRSYGVDELDMFDNESFESMGESDFRGEEYISGTYGKYTNFKQPIGSDWCGITCAAIVLSGYGKDVTPTEIFDKYGFYWRNSFKEVFGPNAGGYSSNLAGVDKQLDSGKPVIVHIKPNNGRYHTSGGHYIALLDKREGNGEIEYYVSDPGGKYVGQKRNGWVPKSIVLKYADKYVVL